MPRYTLPTLRYAALLILITILCAVAWAANATFSVKSTATRQRAIGAITVDLNGDGIPDLVEVTDTLVCNCMTVQLGHGDGTFAAPVQYNFPVTNQSTPELGTADVNHDGKADVIVRVFEVNGNNQFVTHILTYLGNGDGTLAAPIDSSFVGGGIGMVATDVNSDSNVDIVLGITGGSFSPTADNIAVMNGDGRGNFAAPVSVFGPDTTGASPVAAGDFDADGHVDIAITRTHGTCNQGGCSSGTVGILYGNGAGAFSEVDVFTASGGIIPELAVGDLDENGTTDMIVWLPAPTSTGQNLALLYGSRSRTFTTSFLTSKVPLRGGSFGVTTSLADFNGDLLNDFAFLGYDQSLNEVVTDVFLRTSTGSYTQEEVPFSGNTGYLGNLMPADVNRDRKPDLLFGSIANDYAQDTQMNAEVNTTSSGHFDGCAFPAAAHGIHICGPTSGSTVTSPVKLTAAGEWFQMLRKMEVWIDGVKVTEEHFGWDKSQWFEVRKQLAAGAHTATFFTAGLDNALQKTSVTFTVSGTQTCSHPSTAGVHVCSPLSGSIQSSPVLAQAAATVTGTISQMQLWVDGTKKFTVSGTTTMQTSVSLSPGPHRFIFYAVNTAGTKWSATSTFTVE